MVMCDSGGTGVICAHHNLIVSLLKNSLSKNAKNKDDIKCTSLLFSLIVSVVCPEKNQRLNLKRAVGGQTVKILYEDKKIPGTDWKTFLPAVRKKKEGIIYEGKLCQK